MHRISRLYDVSVSQDLTDHDREYGFGTLVSYKDPGVDVRYNFTGEVETDALVNYQVSRREDGPIYSGITVAGTFLDSRVEKEYILYKDLRRLDLTLRIWWWGKRREHLFLALPFKSTDFVETWYGVPFGAIRWPEMLHGDGVKDEFILDQGLAESMDMLAPDDRRHFREVIGWLDLAYANCGITVGTRSTCWWINGSELRASLLRTQYSCGDGRLWNLNQGFHQWTFRIQPHAGDWRDGQAYRVGEDILNRVVCRTYDNWQDADQIREGQDKASVRVVPDSVTVTAMKPSDFRPEALVVRVLECVGGDADVALSFPFTVERAEMVNLVEENPAPLAVSDNAVHFALGPHQFRTIRLYPGGD